MSDLFDPPAPPTSPVATQLAATILLIRDASDTSDALEVFMVERHHKIDFAEGALVFPGGKVDDRDATPELRSYCRCGPLPDDTAYALRVAAIRETFEECGVLLARPSDSDALVDGDRLATLATRYRAGLQDGALSMLELVEAEALELAFDLLVPFAHWVTPEFMPKRFDTHFFLVPAPPDQLAIHDGTESVDSLWTTVPRALELEQTGQRTIIFPTLENVKKLGRSGSVADAIERAQSDPIVTVLPRLSKDPDGTLMMEIPEAAGYDTVRAPMAALSGSMPKGAPRR